MKLTRLASIVVAPALAGGSIATAAIVAHHPAGAGSGGTRVSRRLLAPSRLTGPARQTIAAHRAMFTWSDADPHAAGFRCRLDGGSFKPCKSGVRYRALANGRHTFSLVAIDRHGRSSPVAKGNAASPPPSWSWTIVPAETLGILGNTGGRLYPGAPPVPIDLTLSNPHRYALRVRAVSMTIKAIRAPHARPDLPCTAADFATGGYRGGAFNARSGSSTLRRDGVPSAHWPTIAMVDRPRNQDGCKGATVELAYRGIAGRSSAGG